MAAKEPTNSTGKKPPLPLYGKAPTKYDEAARLAMIEFEIGALKKKIDRLWDYSSNTRGMQQKIVLYRNKQRMLMAAAFVFAGLAFVVSILRAVPSVVPL